MMFNERGEACKARLDDRNTHSDVVLGEKHADDDCRQFGRRRACCHESGTGDIGRQSQFW